MDKAKVFVYGTLKRGGPNHHVFKSRENATAVFRCAAITTSKWPLVVATRYNVPFLLTAEGQGHHVHGEVYDVDQIALASLDELEGHPNYYERTKIRVKSIPDTLSGDVTGESAEDSPTDHFEVWCYVLRRFRPELLKNPFFSNYEFQSPDYPDYVPGHQRLFEVGEDYKKDVLIDMNME